MSEGDGTINFDLGGYAAGVSVPPPPPITSDMPPEVVTWIEQAVAALSLAANMGDPLDNAEAQKGYAERQALATDAMAKFPANEEQSKAKVEGVSDMAQKLPEMASSIGGALAGAIGGAFQPFLQMPQQLAQAAQGFMQQGMGEMGKSAESEALTPEELAEAGLTSEMGGEASELGGGGGSGGDAGGGGGAGGGGIGGTAPMSMLAPPATPSATTTPSSARAMPAAAPAVAAPPTTQSGGMGGYPMMPPGAMHGAGGGDGKDDKADTKRVSVPSLKNGAPVQGRVTAPPTGPTVSKQVDGKTVSTRRIVVPSDRSTEKLDDEPGADRRT